MGAELLWIRGCCKIGSRNRGSSAWCSGGNMSREVEAASSASLGSAMCVSDAMPHSTRPASLASPWGWQTCPERVATETNTAAADWARSGTY